MLILAVFAIAIDKKKQQVFVWYFSVLLLQ